MYWKEEAFANILFETSTFELPKGEEPLLMIGPGTGVTPFIAFLEEIQAKSLKNKAVLYFGCKKSTSDYIYRDQLAEFVDQKLLDLKVAFSREGEWKYVQALLKWDSDQVKDLIMN